MQIIYHIGAHATDDDRLLKCLLKNKEDLVQQGISVPGPSRYRKLIRETMQPILAGGKPTSDARDVLLDTILEEDNVDRLVMSNHHFICVIDRIFEFETFYRLAGPRASATTQLFPNDDIEFHISLRNPATFIPATFAISANKDFENFMGGVDPMNVLWSDVIARIREAAPRAGITVWCNEDTPLLWSQLIRELSGIDPTSKIIGGFDLLAEIMSPEGMQRFHAYLKSHPPQTEIQKRRIIAAFLDKFALEDAIEEEVDLPGWTEKLIDQLTEAYEEDVFKIERMPGVNFITP